MRSLFRDLLTSLLMGLVLPGILLNTADYFLNQPTAVSENQESEAQMKDPAGEMRMLLRNADGSKTEMNLDAYLVGVVLAEMPASFETEALKAQAVAARTYTLKALKTGGKHGDGSVCTKASCCQAYMTEADYSARGGTQEAVDKIRSAVTSTSGRVLTFAGELIEATYFSCSGGTTEDAAAVWGVDFPYLQSVSSPGEENAVHYMDTVSFTPREFQNALGVILSGSPDSWFGETTYTEGGGVSTMLIGGESYSGTQLRELLKLYSTNFTITAGDVVTITTYGYGHRVGMSQYGADAMAVAGSGYEEILSHYYPGTELTLLPSDEA